MYICTWNQPDSYLGLASLESGTNWLIDSPEKRRQDAFSGCMSSGKTQLAEPVASTQHGPTELHVQPVHQVYYEM